MGVSTSAKRSKVVNGSPTILKTAFVWQHRTVFTSIQRQIR
jgi:hypothetical protein